MFLIMTLCYNMLGMYLVSDSRGHKINVKNIYGCRLDTHFAVGGCNTLKASRSK